MLRTGQLHRAPLDAGISPDAGAALPGTLASPRAGLPPAGCRELVARLHRRFLLSVTSAPELLDAHSAGISALGLGWSAVGDDDAVVIEMNVAGTKPCAGTEVIATVLLAVQTGRLIAAHHKLKVLERYR